MLAVHRPSMGSSKPPNLDLPFGYSFDPSTSTFPFPSPTAPAPGPSLLDDNESKLLDSFFDGVDHFNYDFFSNPPDGSELGLGWDELPPTFMGTTSSFGQHPQFGSHGIPEMTFGDLNPHMSTGPTLPPSTSTHDLAAATILQNGSSGRPHAMGNGALFRGQDISIPSASHQVRPPPMAQYTNSRPSTIVPERSHQEDFMRDTFYSDMMFGSQADPAHRPRPVSQKGDIRWGSDVGFTESFADSSIQDKIAALERSHINAVETALISVIRSPTSAGSTRPTSPIQADTIITPTRTKYALANGDDDEDSRPRKRRKSKMKEEVDDEEDSPAPVTHKRGSKKRKSHRKAPSNDSSVPSSEQSLKHRKSASTLGAAAAKQARENLTEDQKRENHIKSEQKRRTLIREGFEDLGELVPGLRGGGFSKSAVLIMAADWLEDLMEGNKVLRARLDAMEGR